MALGLAHLSPGEVTLGGILTVAIIEFFRRTIEFSE
jgi:hypothetical protein